MITICHKFGKSATSQDLDFSDSLWKFNQVYSSTLKSFFWRFHLSVFYPYPYPYYTLKWPNLSSTANCFLKTTRPYPLFINWNIRVTTIGTHVYWFNFAKRRGCSTNISIPFVREFIHLFYMIQVSTHTEDECPLSIISCPYACMGCQTKVSINKVVDVKSKVLHGCFQNKWNNQEVYESSSPCIYACNRILVTLSFIASSKCSQSKTA